MSDLLQAFGPLQDEFYPGSKQRRRESQEMKHERLVEERRVAREDEPWDAHPVEVYIGPTRYEMFRIGALAKALERDSVTIRAWQRKGWLPRNSYQTNPVVGSRGNAGRRLFTRAQIEGIVTIAQEEGLLPVQRPTGVSPRDTNFTARVIAAWRSWR
jgi:hypothetical protein